MMIPASFVRASSTLLSHARYVCMTVLFVAVTVTPEFLRGMTDVPKNIISVFGAGVLLICAGYALFRRRGGVRGANMPHPILLWGVAALGALGGIQFFHGFTRMSFSGIAFEPGTYISFVVLLASVYSAYILACCYGENFVRATLHALISALVIVFGMYGASLFSPALGLYVFGSVGTLNALLGLFTILTWWFFSTHNSKFWHRATFGTILVGAVFFLLIAQARDTLFLVGGVILLLNIKSYGDTVFLRYVKIIGYVFACLLLLFSIFGIHLSSTPDFLNRQEFRLSIPSSLHVVLSSYGTSLDSALVGTGLNSYADAWARFRPLSLNQTTLWNEDVSVGYGLVPTLAVTMGSIFILLYLTVIVGSMFLVFWMPATKNRVSQDVLKILGMASVFIMLFFFLYAPHLGMFVILGCVLGLLLYSGQPEVVEQQPVVVSKKILAGALLGGAVGLFLILCALTRSASLNEYVHAQTLRENGAETPLVIEPLKRSMKYGENVLAARSLAELSYQSAGVLLQKPSLTEEDKGKIDTYLEEALLYGYRARAMGDVAYKSLVRTGSIEVSLGTLHQDGEKLKIGIETYQNAQHYAPTHPIAFFLEAQALSLSGTHEDILAAWVPLRKALQLKPDYLDAQSLAKDLKAY